MTVTQSDTIPVSIIDGDITLQVLIALLLLQVLLLQISRQRLHSRSEVEMLYIVRVGSAVE